MHAINNVIIGGTSLAAWDSISQIINLRNSERIILKWMKK